MVWNFHIPTPPHAPTASMKRLALVVRWLVLLAGAPTEALLAPPLAVSALGAPRAAVRMEQGFQIDPLASSGSLFVLGGFTALQLKIRTAIEKREERDAAAETLRKAEILLLAGKCSAEDVERVREGAAQAADAYEDSRRIIALGGALLRIPDPTASRAERVLGTPSPPPPSPLPREASTDRQQADALDGVRNALGLKRPDAPPSSGSLLPTGSRSLTLKDVAIGFVFVLQLLWFLLSLTDPMGKPNPVLQAALSSGGELVDQREARRAAASEEYRMMLQSAVESGEAPPTCATRRMDDPLGGCSKAGLELDAPPAAPASAMAPGARTGPAGAAAADVEWQRTRGLDSNRAWISGPPSDGGGL